MERSRAGKSTVTAATLKVGPRSWRSSRKVPNACAASASATANAA